MYGFRRQAATLQGIATLLATALVLWVTGTHMFMTAEAANLTYIKDTLSNSAPAEASNHTIEFLSPSGVDVGETIVITFPVGFDPSSVSIADMDLAEAGVDVALGPLPSGATWGVSVSGQDLIFTSGTDTIAPNATVTIEIGDNATFGPGGAARITNPANGSYEFTVTAGVADSGQYRVVIIDDVLVTANIDTTMTFTVTGLPDGTVANGSLPTFATSTSVALPFETLTADVPKTLAQDLAVATNARNGFVVTVEQDAPFQSSTGADIDGFIDGAWDVVPTLWAVPSKIITDENTWGHWGLTSDDATTTRTAEFGVNRWVAASTTPIVIMGHTGPSDGVTPGEGYTRIGYKVEINALQEAGDDYNTTLTYIATPTF